MYQVHDPLFMCRWRGMNKPRNSAEYSLSELIALGLASMALREKNFLKTFEMSRF